ncbi:hypothetical protein T11_15101 [Trichinella zimbabwensis]|uniref:Uncharacterized protein n=1 Tax=Trichinella zimbabwensis TaxID=268475 RepID=A0A0V1GVR1_9BILA|nr:hypothetical protein T11_15101 [Trichinella zimbabwensis]
MKSDVTTDISVILLKPFNIVSDPFTLSLYFSYLYIFSSAHLVFWTMEKLIYCQRAVIDEQKISVE